MVVPELKGRGLLLKDTEGMILQEHFDLPSPPSNLLRLEPAADIDSSSDWDALLGHFLVETGTTSNF